MSQEDLAGSPDSGGDQNLDDTTPLCPACGSKLTRRSMRRTWKDHMKSAFGRLPYRCQICSTRFTVHQNSEAIARHNADTVAILRLREQAARKLQQQAEERSPGEFEI
jgi:tRNA(Ile2) C34 agmatinyltransferase TiaS